MCGGWATTIESVVAAATAAAAVVAALAVIALPWDIGEAEVDGLSWGEKGLGWVRGVVS